MTHNVLNELEIKILLKCFEKKLSKRDITQCFKNTFKAVRDNAVITLLGYELLEEKKMPKLNTRKTPTYYFITERGKTWVKEYLESFGV